MKRLAVAVLACVAACAPAEAATITYVCKADLCRMGPDGSDQRRLTRDGQSSGNQYTDVLNVRDSSRFVAFSRRVSGPFRAAPDLRRREPSRLQYLSTDATHEHGGLGSLGSHWYHARWGETPMEQVFGESRDVYWWKAERLYRPFEVEAEPSGLCLLSAKLECRLRFLSATEGLALIHPDVSPDGRRLVAIDGGRVVLYNARTGERLRALTTGREDSRPSFSPDGRKVVFQRGYDEVYVRDLPAPFVDATVATVPVRGGRVRELVKGAAAAPAWTP